MIGSNHVFVSRQWEQAVWATVTCKSTFRHVRPSPGESEGRGRGKSTGGRSVGKAGGLEDLHCAVSDSVLFYMSADMVESDPWLAWGSHLERWWSDRVV